MTNEELIPMQSRPLLKPVILHAPRWCSQPETISALTGATGAAKESFPL